jgi:hypothetical protein
MFKRYFYERDLMTHLGKITAEIKTGDVPDASTNGRVFLGIGKREFRLNMPGNNFQRGSTDTFVIGVDGNIDNPNNSNDLPSDPSLNAPVIQWAHLSEFPIYIRFDPRDSNDNWNIESVLVTAQQFNASNPGDIVHFADFFSENGDHIWLGNNSGLFIVLGKVTI